MERALFGKKTKFINRSSNKSHYRYVYANSLQEAESKYEDRYGIDYTTWQDDFYWGHAYDIENIKNSAYAEPDYSATIETLKKWMFSDDFLEYCKDRMYPVEIVIK